MKKFNFANFRRKYYSPVIFLFCYQLGVTQTYTFRNYQVENGLSNNTIFCSLQDRKGFMWFGTKDGLNRFDGYHFKLINDIEVNQRKPHVINCLLTDKNGVLWVGGNNGIFRYNYENEKLETVNDTLKNVRDIKIDLQDNLWFISKFTLYRYSLKDKKLSKFPKINHLPITSLDLDSKNQLWISTSNGILLNYNSKSNIFSGYDIFSHSTNYNSKSIQKILTTEKETIFIGTMSQGIKEFDIKTSTYIDILSRNPDNSKINIRDILCYSPEQYWFASESGIFILNTRTQSITNLKKKFLDPFTLNDNAVYTLCKDNEGGLWAGTYFGGINYFSEKNSSFQKYYPDNTKNSISGNAVREICEDKFGNIWIGTEDAGLNKLDRKTGKITQFLPTGKSISIANSNIHGLLANGNELWIGTLEHGIDIMDIRTGNVIRHYNAGSRNNQNRSNFILNFLKSKKGDIYLASSNSLLKYDAKSDGFEQLNLVKNSSVATILEDYNSIIYFGTSYGLSFFNPLTGEFGNLVTNINEKKNLINHRINSIFEDSKQCLWLATEGSGLWKLSKDRKVFKFLNIQNGMPSNIIFKVLEDNDHKMWITTSRGLVNYDPQNGKIITYTKGNGLLSDQFNYNSGYKDATGKLYFGSVKGMISFYPNNLFKEKIYAPIYITDFKVQNKKQELEGDKSVLNKSILLTNKIILPYDKSSFSIDFAALSYIAPEMTVYSYLMEGIDKEWIELKPKRKVNFTNLSPGKYVFKLKAAINGHWNKYQKNLIIIIRPPWWETTWAYLIYTFCLVSLIYFVLRYYQIHLNDKKEKEIYESKIDFFTNIAHEILTPLTLIKGPIENLMQQIKLYPKIKEDVVLLEKSSDRLIKLVSQILDFRKIETKGFELEFKEVNIKTLLNEAFYTFEDLAKRKKIDYQIECESTETMAFIDEEVLNKIFSNLFNNVIKYANKKTYIRLLNSFENQTFTVEFENDGLKIPLELREKIFEPFYRLKENIKQQGTGIGLSLTKTLTKLLKGKIYVKETSDNLTVFVLTLPLRP